MSVSSNRLDKELVRRGLISTRSQAETYIRLGKVKVNGQLIKKAGHKVVESDKVKLDADEQYVSRAALKLASVTSKFDIDFAGKVVLDIGSSTGGFTDYALKHGAKKVIAVDVGTDQLHPTLRDDHRIELHEKTDIRDFKTDEKVGLAVADVSFISLRDILSPVSQLLSSDSLLLIMAKPQFEARNSSYLHKGVIKNDKMRRQILKDLETWLKGEFVIIDKADSGVSGAKGNLERFYLLKVRH